MSPRPAAATDGLSVPLGGRVTPEVRRRPPTGGWRTGVRPVIEFDRCVQCLVCWVYCPDTAIETRNHVVTGIDLTLCKGCEICAAMCPQRAIAMQPDHPEVTQPRQC